MLQVPRRVHPILMALGACAAIGLGVSDAGAESRTLSYVTTGNGFGFQVYHADQRKIVQFLEHPYRFLKPRPGQPNADGIVRRNLVWDLYFGVRGASGGGWLPQGTGPDPEYLDQSHIIHAPISLGGVSSDSYFFAPFDYPGNAMIAVVKAPTATDAFLMLNFHMGAGEETPGSEGEVISPIAGDDAAVMETGPGGGAMVYAALTGLDVADCQGAYAKVQGGQNLSDQRSCSGSDVTIGFQKKLEADGWWAVAVQFVENAGDASKAAGDLKAWANGRSGEQILNDARQEFENWRNPVPSGVTFLDEHEEKLWRQSETVLRMGMVREPYTDTRRNHGMVLASLPRGEWHSGWVRDAAYAIVALARTGHADETRDAVDFFLDADPVGKYTADLNAQIKAGETPIDDYRVSVVRYYGTGEEEADYSGQPTPNVETDGWGMVLWTARQYVDNTGDVAWLSKPTKLQPNKTTYDVLAEGVATPLERYMEPNGIQKKESGIWEVHQGHARHFAYTTLAAARGFCDMAALSARLGRDADQVKYHDLAKKTVQGFVESFADGNKAFVGSLEGTTPNRADAAVVEVFTWNIIADYSLPYVEPTFSLLDTLQVTGGGYKRNDESQSNYDNHEWILIDLRISNAFRRAGKTDRADTLLHRVVSKAVPNFYLLPELYSAVQSEAAIGSYWGSIPMVGYGAGAYMMTILDRAGMIEPNDCGTKPPPPPPSDGGTGGGNVGGAGGSGGGEGGMAGTGGTDDCGLLGCGAEGGEGGAVNADGSEIPRKSACYCRIDEPHDPLGWAAALCLLLPASLAWRRLRRRSFSR